VNPSRRAVLFFSALTREYPASARRILARTVAMNSFVLLNCFLSDRFAYPDLLRNLPSVVQVGGGLIVISNGWAMLNSKEDHDREGQARKRSTCRTFSAMAFYPLTLPLTVGPGSISIAITLGKCGPPPRPESPRDSRRR